MLITSQYSLIILDLGLPDMDGASAAAPMATPAGRSAGADP
jgi:DNA-binding response OmpR family regulator